MRTSLTLSPEHVAVGPREVDVLEDAVRERAGGNGLIERSPCGADDEHFARLDVAHVGGADQIHRAGLGADDPGVAEPAERERPEPVRIAHGDQPIAASASTSENAPRTCVTDSTTRLLDAAGACDRA